jgi:hypothetical protein
MCRCGVHGFLVDDGSHDGWGAIGGDIERDKWTEHPIEIMRSIE